MQSLGICLNGFTALRAAPKSSANMVSSLVFGEQYIVHKKEKEWLEIENISDGYKGWLSRSNHNPIDILEELEIFNSIGTVQNVFTAETIQVGPGTYWPKKKKVFDIGEDSFEFVASIEEESSDLLEVATLFLGVPYLWGGRSVYGIDCSGFSQMVYRAAGIKIPRDSSPQSKISPNKSPYIQLEPGDLAFFKSQEGNINHVGVVMEDDEIIHASGSVHIDEFTEKGIYNAQGKLTHPFAWGIKKP